MLFSVTFFLNAAANFAFGIALSAILGPAEFGRYATAALAAITLAGATLDWLRYVVAALFRRARGAGPHRRPASKPAISA